MFIFGISVTLIIPIFYSVQGQILSFCEDPIEGQLCQITCTTPDHNQAVSFRKTSIGTTIGSCSGGTCGASPPYSISQPTGTTTVLSFSLTRNDAEEWQCDYGSLPTKDTLKWGTYPSSITANGFPTSTEITTEQEVDVKLECLYSENPPIVTLYHTDSTSISSTPLAPVTCTSTAEVCTDSDFMTYTCKVKISPSDQLDCTETYSLGVYVKISNVETASNSSALGTGITYECQALSTHLASTSDVIQSTVLVTTDGGEISLNTLSNLPDETMILSSKSPTVAETFYSLSQTQASSNISLYHTSNTYTNVFLMTRLTTSILDGFFSFSLSDSLAQDLRSQITSLYGIVSTQSHIDNTPLTSFTYTDNLQLSLEIVHQPSLSPSSDTHLTTLSIIDTNSKLPTTFTFDKTSKLYSSSIYLTSVDLEISFDFNSETKDGKIRTSTSEIIETMTFNSIETNNAKRNTKYDYSSNMLINSPITSFGNSSGTMIVRPTIVDFSTSLDSFFETFEDRPSTLSVNSFQPRSLSESETIGIIMSTSVETSNEYTNTIFKSSWIASSTPLNHMHEPLSLNYDVESENVSKAINSDSSVLFDSFSILGEKDSNNMLSTTPEVVVWSRGVSRASLGSLSHIESSSYDSSKNMISISANSDRYSSATNIHLSQPNAYVSSILPSVSQYFYSSDIDITSSSLLMSSSVDEHPMLTYDPSLTKTSKVIAISVTVVGCILFVAITILVLFVFKLLRCTTLSKVPKTNKKFSNTDSNSLSFSIGGRRGFSLFDKPYGLPTRYYDKTAASSNDNRFSCTYNENWDDIT